jgi:hypothetical protein
MGFRPDEPSMLHKLRPMKALALTLLVAMTIVTSGEAGTQNIVLGNKNLVNGGKGWGAAHPARIFNGGDPSGQAWNLRWRNWGAARTDAVGLAYISRPNSGYYATPGAIEFQAYRVGHCKAGGPLAYTRLRARVVSRPGGPLGQWFAWSPSGSICSW